MEHDPPQKAEDPTKPEVPDRPDEEDPEEERREKKNRKISFWAALILATGLTGWYYATHPPDPPEIQRMRLFFKNNITDVVRFLKMAPAEQKEYAKTKIHPFYEKYLDASTVEQSKIRALVHMSYDYNPNQYWFNLVFLWAIWFTAFWFIGVMTEGALILLRRQKRDKETKQSI